MWHSHTTAHQPSKEEILTHATAWMNPEDLTLSARTERFPSHEVPRVVRVTETKQNGGCQGLGEEGTRSCSMGSEFQLCKMERALETDAGDGRTTVGMHFMPLNCTFKNGEDGKFYVTCMSQVF